MALPIKPKDTQEGCNPISSNCVIWQGPDIPCIKLCTGDSVSDTVAKLAEQLCTITDQLNISVLDISCFGALAPAPGDFKDVVQLLIDRTCIVETVLENNGFNLNPTDSDCPDSCLVSVAQCLQPTDLLGNLVTELPLRDYILLIGTRICTIVAEVNTITSAVTDLQNRLTTAETEIQNIINDPNAGVINITSGRCIGGGVEKTIQTFLLDFEEEYCDFVERVGTNRDINDALLGQCATLDLLPQLSDSRAIMANLPGWVPIGQYTALAHAVGNLWRTVCDMREAIITLQESNAACCGVTCNDIIWSFTVSGVRASRFLDFYFSGSVPTGFDYCRGDAGMAITIKDSVGNVGTYTRDIVTSINNGAPLEIDILGTTAIRAQAIWYNISIPLRLCNDDLECNSTRTFELYNDDWCDDRAFTLQAVNILPNVSGRVIVTFSAATAQTTYIVTLYQVISANNAVAITSWTFSNISGGNQTYTFPTLYDSGNQYYAVIDSIQTSAEFGEKQIRCRTEAAIIPL